MPAPVTKKKKAAPPVAKKKVKTVGEQIKDLENGANGILADLDTAQVFKSETCKEFPSFDHAAIASGKLLGKGGFSDVFEVSNILLTPDAVATTASSASDDDYNMEGVDLLQEDGGDDEEEFHYDLHTAQSYMSKRCIRKGSCRYAVKRLRKDLSALDRTRGLIDLAIEIKFFRVLWHPNIVKMRAISSTPRLSADTFIVMDRLYGTLEDKIEGWHKIKGANQGCCMGLSGRNKPALKELMKERLLVAYDLASAINYLHGHR
jgi:hypothetical protein